MNQHPAKEAEIRNIINAAEKLGRLMVSEMADHAATIHRRHGDEHGATVLTDFANMVREDKEPAPVN